MAEMTTTVSQILNGDVGMCSEICAVGIKGKMTPINNRNLARVKISLGSMALTSLVSNGLALRVKITTTKTRTSIHKGIKTVMGP
ncbi:hypothetical protein ACFODZ_03770 [Marinicella sediminis]|uniref:Uncharacterized protein n=1 Tax=Marinicella sediminis TaxID=1792834 RepID=A0ABV7J8E1_9GAMM